MGPMEIYRAWLNGNYTEAVAALEIQEPSAERDFLLTQAYLRWGRHPQALALLSEVLLRETDECNRARARSFQSVAFAATSDRRRSRDASRKVGERNYWDEHTNLEIALNDALAAWMWGDVSRAEAIVNQDTTQDRSRIDPYIAARFVMLRSWILAAREDYTGQANVLIEAVEQLQLAPVLDVGLMAWTVHALATLVRDIDMRRGFDLAQEVEASLQWTDELSVQHFQTVRALAWCLALQGEYIRAFRRIAAAKPLATGPVEQLLLHLDHAHIAFISGQQYVARAELSEADDLIRSYDWTTSVWEEAPALIQAAELFSGVDPHRADELLTMAAQIKGQMARNVSYSHDRRYAAMSDFAEALVREAVPGRRETARLRALRAFEVFEAIGYQWRAARCAVLIHVITGQDEWLARARELCEPYPRSFIAQEVRRREGLNVPVDRLTVRQRHIYELLCEGKSTDEIGQNLGISPNTVRIHLGRIYGTFGVKSRAQLLAKVSAAKSA